ncbi:hypothetical protein BHAMNSH16_07080 [Brachyspira hampsonii]|uniref:Uncharacterized protein n=3 Tax=Brachyspira hampsonii TaxID=1287055 RepID=A0AAC9XKM4_9SPIR|nr:hypothetical protein [Brachyspira hampsonii]ASJ21418.1 hypothetical protein BHAMNSH16_07080 [Brachyspira hampsonii]OEJ19675.1 hypothetical protein A9496_03455 [Brachyspira hampsonii]
MSEIGINSMLDTIDDIKTNKLKFNLLIGGKECRTLEEVKENFNIDDIKKYYDSDLLERWLLNNDYKDLCSKIQALKSKYIFDHTIGPLKAHPVMLVNVKQELKDTFFPEYKKDKIFPAFTISYYDDHYNYNDYKNYSTADEYFYNYKKIVNVIINDSTDYIKSYIDLLAERYSYFFYYDYKNFIKKIMENKNYYALFCMFYNDFMRYYLKEDDNVSNFINEKIIKNISEKVNNDFSYVKYYSKSESNSDGHFIEISNKECIILYIENASVTSINNKEKVYNKDKINNKFIKINGIRYNWQYNNKIVYIEM